MLLLIIYTFLICKGQNQVCFFVVFLKENCRLKILCQKNCALFTLKNWNVDKCDSYWVFSWFDWIQLYLYGDKYKSFRHSYCEKQLFNMRQTKQEDILQLKLLSIVYISYYIKHRKHKFKWQFPSVCVFES